MLKGIETVQFPNENIDKLKGGVRIKELMYLQREDHNLAGIGISI